ncbi:hypothetical protein [Streptomyces sp. NPDC054786]
MLEKKYPTIAATQERQGKVKFIYKTQAMVGEDSSQTKGWSVGGKASASLTGESKPDGVGSDGGLGAEASFEYSESTTTNNKWTNTTEEATEGEVPDGVIGSLEGRANGGTYIGYIVKKEDLTSSDGTRRSPVSEVRRIGRAVVTGHPL